MNGNGRKRQGRTGQVTALFIRALFFLALGSLQGAPVLAEVLRPAGPAAARITTLWWVMFWTALFVCLAVFTLLAVALRRPRTAGAAGTPAWSERFVVTFGIVIPSVILLVLLVWSLSITAALAVPADTALTIRVTAHQWWWEVHYPEQDFVTANELHVPAGLPVRIELTSADVIHSFWVPGLNGKVDAIPGQVTELWLEAGGSGVHRGHCAEFCGVQHGNMKLLVLAEPRASFDAWLELQQQPAAGPVSDLAEQGLLVFQRSPCLACHTVRGTSAQGRAGPDLTHLASRRTLGAAIISNTRENLAAWISNSQAIKPGNAMPPMPLPPADLEALLAWLGELQ
jgi:cytochrome c oxidase subunit 2